LRAEPCAGATRGCPQAPFAEFTDHQDAAGLQNPSNLPKHRSRIRDKAKDRHGNDDIEAFGVARDACGLPDHERHVRAFPLSSHPRGFDHFRRGINASHGCASTP
jgi:hypothetical protein